LSESNDVARRITLAPDPRLVRSLGANHTLESAIADLVDNSIDAGASTVWVRLLTNDGRLVQVEVHDNGSGMDERTIDDAMTIGHQREYNAADLGHFGMGLKQAAFGNCDVLTVWSANSTLPPVGRRIKRVDYSTDFGCEVLTEASAALHTQERKTLTGTRVGTSVVWTQMRSSYHGRSDKEAIAWLATVGRKLRTHLGVTFHRLLERKRLAIFVHVDELGAGQTIRGTPVKPLDPFGYTRTGDPRYPKKLLATLDDRTNLTLTCHIWPAKSTLPSYTLGGKHGREFQGFYIYRNDRLLQIGGWGQTATYSPGRQLARVMLEDDGTIGRFLTMNPEKNSLRFEHRFQDVLGQALASDGTTFTDYLKDAEDAFTTATKRDRSRKPVIKPDKGLPAEVRKQVADELSFIDGQSIDLKWRSMPEGELFDIDRSKSSIWLNSRYRHLFVGDRGSQNDAPVLKTLLYLLTHHVFQGQNFGPRSKDDINLWKNILGVAVTAEQKLYEKREETWKPAATTPASSIIQRFNSTGIRGPR
jgi:hypothetical protein